MTRIVAIAALILGIGCAWSASGQDLGRILERDGNQCLMERQGDYGPVRSWRTCPDVQAQRDAQAAEARRERECERVRRRLQTARTSANSTYSRRVMERKCQDQSTEVGRYICAQATADYERGQQAKQVQVERLERAEAESCAPASLAGLSSPTESVRELIESALPDELTRVITETLNEGESE